MKVAFLVGNKSQDLIDKMSKTVDNIEFFTFSNLDTMIEESKIRNLFFDRIVFIETLVNGNKDSLVALNNYVKEYASSTPIVMVCRGMVYDNIKIFKEVFKSPMYISIIEPRITIPSLITFVTEDILSLKTQYQKSEEDLLKRLEDEKKGLNSDNFNTNESKNEKRGFFPSIFGSNKNKSKISQNNKISNNQINTSENVGEMVSNNSQEVGYSQSPNDSEISSILGSSDNGIKNETEESFTFSQGERVLVGVENNGDEISPEYEDLDNLGVGNFGEMHSDTGYLTEDEEDEIINSLENNQELTQEDNQGDELPNQSEQELVDEGRQEPLVYNKPIQSSSEEPVITETHIVDNRVTLYSGIRGVGVTSKAIDKAVMYVEQGKSVLLVDLDFRENGLLSFIDTKKFYDMKCNKGLSTKRIYMEDGVSIISNGYNQGLNANNLTEVLTSLTNFDYIIIDCPLDCIGRLSSSNLDMVDNILIYINGDRGNITSAIKYLTEIDCVKEDTIYEKSEFIVEKKSSDYKEDLSYLRNVLYFGRGDWLEKLS